MTRHFVPSAIFINFVKENGTDAANSGLKLKQNKKKNESKHDYKRHD